MADDDPGFQRHKLDKNITVGAQRRDQCDLAYPAAILLFERRKRDGRDFGREGCAIVNNGEFAGLRIGHVPAQFLPNIKDLNPKP